MDDSWDDALVDNQTLIKELRREVAKLRAELDDCKKWKDITASNHNHLRQQVIDHLAEIRQLRQALETWKRSAKIWRDRATYGDRWHSDDLGCDYIGDYKLYRLLRRGGE